VTSVLAFLEAPTVRNEVDERDEREWVLSTIRRMAPGYRLALLAALGEKVQDNRPLKTIATSRKDGIKLLRKRLGVTA
jgi:hypothetical protein